VLGGARQDPTDAGWTSPFYSSQILSLVAGYIPELVNLAAGGTNAMAAWSYQDSQQAFKSDFFLTGLQRTDTSWESPQLLSVLAPNVVTVSLALNDGGSGVATWNEPALVDAGPIDEFAALFASTLVLGPPQDLTKACPAAAALVDAGYSTLAEGAAAINGDSRAAVVWVEAHAASFILGATYDPANGWGPCSFVGGDGGIWGTTADNRAYPGVADIGGGKWGTFWIDYANFASFTGEALFESGSP
jgi:hypothetical protein